MFILDGKKLALGRPFTVGVGSDAIQHPANWLERSTPEEREAFGITEVPDVNMSYNTKFWIGYDENDNLIPQQFEDITCPITGVTTEGIRSLIVREQAELAGNKLKDTDWYVVRNSETGVATPAGITSFRTEVRSVCDQRQQMLAASVDNEQIEDLIVGDETTVVGFTTTLLPEWPVFEDFYP